jgi:hypothetical protein
MMIMRMIALLQDRRVDGDIRHHAAPHESPLDEV